MGSMESFYGGRQGASFVIVKRFDGLDIPQTELDPIYRVGCFAQDIDGYFYVIEEDSKHKLIERTAKNYTDYPGWGFVPKDGVTTVTSQSGITSDPLPLEYAEGMKQCFEKGGETASEVGYGEYVIIDPIFGLNEYGNPDNGKVYRRGMNYDEDLGGAEYIGQIVGPKGDVPEVDMTTIEEISELSESQIREYDISNGGIVPGKYSDGGIINYNDDITYGWATLRDNYDNVIGALIGFTFPYLVAEMGGETRIPYYQEGDDIPPGYEIGDRLPSDFDLFVDNGFDTEDRNPTHGDTGHPYYRKWKLEVPQGIKGDSQTQLLVIPDKVQPGAGLWSNKADLQAGYPPTTQAIIDNYVVSDLDDTEFDDRTIYPYNIESDIIGVIQNDTKYYAKLEDGFALKLTYIQTNYDYHISGDQERIVIGDYNTIKGLWLDNDGVLYALYSSTDEQDPINQNTPIPWVTDINLDQNGTLAISFNNERLKDEYTPAKGWIWDSSTHTGTKTINFIDYVTIDEDGTIHFWYSNGRESSSSGTRNLRIKYLKKAEIDTGLNLESSYDFDGEGTGDQKIHFTWNTGVYNQVIPGGSEDPSALGWYELNGSSYFLTSDTTVVSGKNYYKFTVDENAVEAPINYIMETIVTTYDPKAPATPQNHLLVLYSDPAYRNWLATNYPNKIYRYTSQKFTEEDPSNPGGSRFITRDDWFDLGYVKGEPGGLHIIGEYILQSGETYQDYLTDGLPPEMMPGNTSQERGWAYLITDPNVSPETRTIYTYDYIQGHENWTTIGEITNVTTDPTQIVILDSSKIDPSTGAIIPDSPSYLNLPKEAGLWFIKSNMKSAY